MGLRKLWSDCFIGLRPPASARAGYHPLFLFCRRFSFRASLILRDRLMNFWVYVELLLFHAQSRAARQRVKNNTSASVVGFSFRGCSHCPPGTRLINLIAVGS